jgi:hypothetical protein
VLGDIEVTVLITADRAARVVRFPDIHALPVFEGGPLALKG